MRKLLILAVSCVCLFLLTACGESQYYSSNGYEPSDSSSGRALYRSNDSSEAYYTSGRGGAPFGGYPVNPNATCTTNCPGGNCQLVK